MRNRIPRRNSFRSAKSISESRRIVPGFFRIRIRRPVETDYQVVRKLRAFRFREISASGC